MSAWGGAQRNPRLRAPTSDLPQRGSTTPRRLCRPVGQRREGFFTGIIGGSLVYRASSCHTRQTPGPNGATHVSLGWSAAQPQVASPHVRSAPTGQHNTATIVPPRWGGCRVMAFVLGFRGCAATPQAHLCGPVGAQSPGTNGPIKKSVTALPVGARRLTCVAR